MFKVGDYVKCVKPPEGLGLVRSLDINTVYLIIETRCTPMGDCLVVVEPLRYIMTSRYDPDQLPDYFSWRFVKVDDYVE